MCVLPSPPSSDVSSTSECVAASAWSTDARAAVWFMLGFMARGHGVAVDSPVGSAAAESGRFGVK